MGVKGVSGSGGRGLYPKALLSELMIGLITPPMGLCLFVADSVANVGLGRLTRQIIPLFFVELAVLIIISFFPYLI